MIVFLVVEEEDDVEDDDVEESINDVEEEDEEDEEKDNKEVKGDTVVDTVGAKLVVVKDEDPFIFFRYHKIRAIDDRKTKKAIETMIISFFSINSILIKKKILSIHVLYRTKSSLNQYHSYES